MKKKFIGIPMFLYLLLSVNITTCAPKTISKQENQIQEEHQKTVEIIKEVALKALKPVTNISGDDVFLVDLLCPMAMEEIQSLHDGNATLQKNLQDSYKKEHATHITTHLKNPKLSNSVSCDDFQDRLNLIVTAKVTIPEPVARTPEEIQEQIQNVFKNLTDLEKNALRSNDPTISKLALIKFINLVITEFLKSNTKKVLS